MIRQRFLNENGVAQVRRDHGERTAYNRHVDSEKIKSDAEVCLNCTLKKCSGKRGCFLRMKRKKEGVKK